METNNIPDNYDTSALLKETVNERGDAQEVLENLGVRTIL